MKNTRLLLSVLIATPLLGAWLHGSRTEEPAAPEEAILGVWNAFEAKADHDPMRFYYFHDGGIGLFRFGKRGLNQTNSYTYELEGDQIRFVFTKTGEHFVATFRVFEKDGATWLELEGDPRMGGTQRYKKAPYPSREMDQKEHPFARLWIAKSKDRSGNVSFNLYQLEAPTLDGRGVGWFHTGDFNDWSTETLVYRKGEDSLELFFPVRNERQVTRLDQGAREGTRYLYLEEDPRNFWHPRHYEDGGPGFTSFMDGGPMPYRVHGHAACGGSGE